MGDIDPSIWGPPHWEVLFTEAAAATNIGKLQVLKNTVHNWANPYGLPCGDCGRHFYAMVRTPGLRIEDHSHSNESLVKLVWMWKNEVNARIGKPLFPWAPVKAKYLSKTAACTGTCRGK